jgi:uncharacterized membrane protein
MPRQPANNLHKEFELERLILFSDAVFAIAITLLIIEIKFPEFPEHADDISMLKLFKPTIIQFIGFIISFYFIGNFWMRHLKLCRLLIGYDDNVMRRNLLFLFFIITFPFTASGITEHIRPDFIAPVFIYMINIGLVGLAQLWLCHYIFYKKPSLTLPGHEAEKKFMYTRSLFATMMIVVVVTLMSIIALFARDKLSYAFFAIPVIVVFSRRRLIKFKKAMLAEQAMAATHHHH